MANAETVHITICDGDTVSLKTMVDLDAHTSATLAMPNWHVYRAGFFFGLGACGGLALVLGFVAAFTTALKWVTS